MAKANKQKKSTAKKDSTTRNQSAGKNQTPGFLHNVKLHCGLIFLLSFLLYANTLMHDYTQDDAIVIYDNMFTTEGISGIPGILKYDTFYGFFKEAGKANLVSGGRYRPLTLVMFAVEYQIFGDNPFWGHLINVILFGMTGVLLYLLILKLLKPHESRNYAAFIALVTAVIFVAHPIHTEAVANIKGRDEILTLLGSLTALYLCLKAFYEKNWTWNLAAAVVFFLSLFSKENAITFLAIIPLSFYIFTNAKLGDIVKIMVPFIVATGLFLGIRTAVIGAQFGGEPMELMNNPYLKIQGNQYVPFTTGERSATIVYTLGKYVQLLLFPHPLTHDYYPRHVEIMNWSNWKVLLSLFLYLGIFIYAIWGLFKKDPVAYGILFYLITLSIVSNIVFPIGTNMAERFMFMPSLGFAFVIAILLYKLSAMLSGNKRLTFQNLYPGLGVTLLLTILLAGKTVTRNMAWKDNYTLFTTDIKTSKRSAKLLNAVGGELTSLSVKEKEESKRKAMAADAINYLEKALKIHPNYKNTYLLLGNAYNYLEQYEQSISSYKKALRLDSDYKDAKNNLGITYRNAGRFYGEKKGDLQKSIQYLNEAALLRPEEYETLRLLGVAYGIQGNNPKAIEFFQKAADADPKNADAWFNLASAWIHAGNQEKGNEFRQKAIAINPNIEQERGRQNQQ